jgi:FkbH-like protein
VSQVFRNFEAQDKFFAELPKRNELRKHFVSKGPPEKTVRVNVWVNHSFNFVEPVVAAYSSFFGGRPEFRISDFDDSLSFAGWVESDLELIWWDPGRYRVSFEDSSLRTWILNRITALRLVSSSPIIVCPIFTLQSDVEELRSAVGGLASVFVSDLAEDNRALGLPLLDERMEEVSGSSLSKEAHVLIGRRLACNWIPAAVYSPIKSVVVDLDNTLYSGVLGEDGVGGVTLTEGHRNLQAMLADVGRKGVFLGLISKNNLIDVEELFTGRPDFPLKLEDFAAVKISWKNKGEMLAEICNDLRISQESVVYVDDNLGELMTVRRHLPQVSLIFATPNAEQTRRNLEFQPGLWRWAYGREDGLRLADLAANRGREKLKALSVTDYLRELGAVLTVSFSENSQAKRLSGLSSKTNQFNLAQMRLSETEVIGRMTETGSWVASVELFDNLSDSGVIAFVSSHQAEDTLIIDELCVSCRALGRELEDPIIVPVIQAMIGMSGAAQVKFNWRIGERNKPALDWIGRWADLETDVPEGVAVGRLEQIMDYKIPTEIIIRRKGGGFAAS